MKVLQVMPNFSLAGAEIMCENLVYALKNQGVDVVVVSFYDQKSAITDRLEAAGITVHYLGKKSGLDLSLIGKLKKLFKEERPDVVHTHRYAMQYAIPAAIMAGVKARVHTVQSIATKELGRGKRILAKLFYKNHGVVPVALSDAVKGTVVSEYKLPESRIPVIFNGVDLSKCNPKKDYAVNDKFRILHIGRFEAVKNHEMLIRAFDKFYKAHPESELFLVGDGELRPNIETLADELELRESVRFLGIQSDVHGFLSDADAFILPSVYEGIPMTLIEAMGSALPIIASNVGGIPDMLNNGESAILTVVNADAFANAMSSLYEDEQLRRSLGTSALSESVNFSAEEMAKKYKEVYASLIER